VVAGEDRHQRPVDGGRAAAPGGKPEGDFLEPPERARRLGQLRVAFAGRHQRAGVRSRQVAEKGAKIVERQA
jgi:hypothetical protein